MTFDLSEWLNLIFRWFHVVAGITWIGQTYLFNRLDAHMSGAEQGGPSDQDAWMVHGGGFYRVQAQKVPKPIPDDLLWFKWESALTWISGFLLLIVVYYAGGLMVEPDSGMSQSAAVLCGLGALIGGVVLYNLLWRSPLGKNEPVGGTISYLMVLAAAWGLTRVMTVRAAYLHIGAAFGTIMATNVWMTILPGQRQMIAARKAGLEPDYALGARGKRCSKHNTFMSVPLVLLMISNHFPTATYGSQYGWQTLGALVLVGWGAANILRRL